ncbi:hypothetical protein [Nonomuraea sp. MG754425]|uniref:hypothetical protein n=1 Tax=Nonomuraea sp. MG754425 TaxID=2570319 RepID=UPI001F314CF5|nr:hypothetical protein [Nonomuraea sp. MG754425]
MNVATSSSQACRSFGADLAGWHATVIDTGGALPAALGVAGSLPDPQAAVDRASADTSKSPVDLCMV